MRSLSTPQQQPGHPASVNELVIDRDVSVRMRHCRLPLDPAATILMLKHRYVHMLQFGRVNNAGS